MPPARLDQGLARPSGPPPHPSREGVLPTRLLPDLATAWRDHPVRRLTRAEKASMGAPTQCCKCFRAMAGSLGRHAGSRRCAFYEAAHQAVDAGSNPPAGLVAADPDAAPPQPPRRASNWDAGIHWLGTLDPSDHLQAPGGRMTLDDFPSKPSAALFGDCVDLTLALYKDHPTEVAMLLHLLPRMLLGRLSQERLDLTPSSAPYGRSRLIEATVKDRCKRFLDDSANWELLHNEAHVELATAEAKLLAAARDPCAPHVTKSEADRVDRLVQKLRTSTKTGTSGTPTPSRLQSPCVCFTLRMRPTPSRLS